MIKLATKLKNQGMKDVTSTILEGTRHETLNEINRDQITACLLYTSPSPRDKRQTRMPSSA